MYKMTSGTTRNSANLHAIADLARSLRQEHLFVQQEHSTFANYFDTIQEDSTLIYKLSYICSWQKQYLRDASSHKCNLFESRPIDEINCFGDKLRFMKSKEVLEYEVVLVYEKLFEFLYRSPKLLAQILHSSSIQTMKNDGIEEDDSPDANNQLNDIISILYKSLFGNALNNNDLNLLFEVLRHLICLNPVPNESMQGAESLFRTNSLLFIGFYQKLSESVLSAKTFLTAVLHEPIMNFLCKADMFLHNESGNAVTRLYKTYLEENNAEKVEEQQVSVDYLFQTVNEIVNNLRSSWCLFPLPLRYFLWTLNGALSKCDDFMKCKNDVRSIFIDLVFRRFICPAIEKADVIGIINTPISETVSNQLTEISRILETLALANDDERYCKHYSNFYLDSGILSNLINALLEDQPPILDESPADKAKGIFNAGQNDFRRQHLFITKKELIAFTDFLMNAVNDREAQRNEQCDELLKLLQQVPKELILKRKQQQEVSHSSGLGEFSLKDKIKPSSFINLNKTSKANKTPKSNGNPLELITRSLSHTYNNSNETPSLFSHLNDDGLENEIILTFDLPSDVDSKLQPPLSEEEVLLLPKCIAANGNDASTSKQYNMPENCNNELKNFDIMQDISEILTPSHSHKTENFGLGHDDISYGNSSDILEAASEVQSNHSVTSSIELEEENDQNDNLSDMVSANVSGRGSPNISGRDTPSSQVTDGDLISNLLPTPQMQKLISKARSDIEDKFCKFEIRKIEGDGETVSVMSDTWSTDVLASDSETMDVTEQNREYNIPGAGLPPPPSHVITPQNFDISIGAKSTRPGYWDMFDQRSESNWSTDVLVSDSEKINEMDNDDIGSTSASFDSNNSVERMVNEREPMQRKELQNFQRAQKPSNSQEKVSSLNELEDANGSFRRPLHCHNERVKDAHNANACKNKSSGYFTVSSLERSSMPIHMNPDEESNSVLQSDYNSTPQHNGNYATEPLNALVFPLNAFRTFAESNSDNKKNVTDAKKLLLNRYHQFKDDENDVTNNLIDFNGNCEVRKRHKSAADASVPSEFSLDHHHALKSSNAFEGNTPENGENLSGNAKPVKISPTEEGIRKEQEDAEAENSSLYLKISQLKIHDKSQDDLNVYYDSSSKAENGKGAHKDTTTTSSTSQRSMKSTGTIPKSISFESTVAKVENLLYEELEQVAEPIPVLNGTNNSGILSKLKQGIFRNRRGHRNQDNNCNVSSKLLLNYPQLALNSASSLLNPSSLSQSTTAQTTQENVCGRQSTSTYYDDEVHYAEVSDDILEKYRRKISNSNEKTLNATTETSEGEAIASILRGNGTSNDGEKQHPERTSKVNSSTLPFLNDSKAKFNIVKNKLRAILSKTELHLDDVHHTLNQQSTSPLLTYLQIQLAHAINTNNFQQITYLSEAMRSLSSLDVEQHFTLLKELQDDVKDRHCYMEYLIKYRQNLSTIKENIKQYELYLRKENGNQTHHSLSNAIRLFLRQRKTTVDNFLKNFAKLTAYDDKIDSIEEHINELMTELLLPAAGILHNRPEYYALEARNTLELMVLQRVYQQVLFPNDDADLARDLVLSKHIRKLQNIITPQHSSLCVSREYLHEAPWDFAQKQLSYITAYVTPKDKLRCVIRCITSLTNLLNITSNRSPSADDILPVLIYIVIMVNPPFLLSTIEYINCFIGEKLAGEEQFYWTLFGSVVKFIKTMDYIQQ